MADEPETILVNIFFPFHYYCVLVLLPRLFFPLFHSFAEDEQRHYATSAIVSVCPVRVIGHHKTLDMVAHIYAERSAIDIYADI